MKSINQALGRTIRHSHDYGSAFLIDSRLAQPRYQQMLSPWLRERLTVSGPGGPPLGRLERFYEEMEEKEGRWRAERDRAMLDRVKKFKG